MRVGARGEPKPIQANGTKSRGKELGERLMMCSSKRKSAMASCGAVASSKRKKGASVPGWAASLPEEMVTEVLLRLPVKSIVRFRAVCRSWAALLSSEKFRARHFALANKAAPAPSKLLHFAPTARFDATAVYFRSLSSSSSGPRVGGDQPLFSLDHARGNGVAVLTPASCRGLTLLHDALASALYLCNAATKEVTRLPPFPDAPSLLRPSTTGLGFDARTGEHKVVRLINETLHVEEPIRCEVYTPSGGGDRWRPAAGAVPPGLREFAISAVLRADDNRLPPVFANGSLHWLIRRYLEFASPEAAIVSFSVTDETFGCVRSPPLRASDCEQQHPFPPELILPFLPCAPDANLVEMDDQLCMVRDLRKNPYGSNLEIWRLLDYSSGDWLLNHRIDLSARVARELREPQTVRVLGFIGDCRSGKKTTKKIIIATCKHMFREKFEKKVHTYDLGSESLETILSVTETLTHASSVGYRPPRSRFSLFQESFAPVHRTDEETALSSAMAKAIKGILLRLPAKSVMQSKLICKQWLTMIKSESFIQSYFEHKNMDRRPKVMLVGKGTGQSVFSFAPLDRWLGEARSHSALLDIKVVCSKPCHGMNLVTTESETYLYNPCTGFHSVYGNLRPDMHPPTTHEAEDHPFVVGNKNVGLTFDPQTREHAVVAMHYHLKDFESRQYNMKCYVRWCNYRYNARRNSVPLPPLPVNDMPPAYVEGVLYWMSEPRLGRSAKRAIVSFDIATRSFDVIPCPSCIAIWSITGSRRAFVVELQGALCAVLADAVANSLDVWKMEHGQWGRAYTICLEALPDYSLGTNVVVPLAVDPCDGRILLNTGRKIGLYDPVEQTIQNLYSVDQAPLDRSTPHLTASSDDLTFSEEDQSVDNKIMPFVPMLYEESLACYGRPRWLP